MEQEKLNASRNFYAESLINNLANDPQNKEILEELCKTLEIKPEDIFIGDFYKTAKDVNGKIYDFPYIVAIGHINAGELSMDASRLKYVKGDLTGGFDECKTILSSLEVVDGNFWLENNTPNKLPHIRKITGEFSGNIYNIPEFPKDLECGSVVLYTTTEPTDRRSTGKMSYDEFKENEPSYKILFPQINKENPMKM